MKKSGTKILAVCLGAALVVGGTGATAFALASEKDTAASELLTADAKVLAEASSASVSGEGTAVGETAAEKDETVYVLAGADGSVQKIIVSDWLKNAQNSATLTENSDLDEVENIKGDESYTMDGDHMRVWDAQGNDIYYQGITEKELPVELSVSYLLDGKSISAEELAGKSGRVTIRFDYTNRQSEYVEIDGQKEEIYVPFAMLTGVLLDNDVFTNVEVSGGKLINDGDRTAVIGIAFPGLQENLAIDSEKLEIPDHVEITADATSFEMGMTVTVATNEIFSCMSTDELDSVDDLEGSLGELSAAVEQLTDGSSALYDGLCTLLEKSGELAAGIDQLAAGASAVKSGAGELDTGMASLQTGAAQLDTGLNTLAASNDTLNQGAAQIFQTLLATADSQLAAAGLQLPALTIENYAGILDQLLASLDTTDARQNAMAQSVAELKASLDSYHAFYSGLLTYTSGVAGAASGADELKAGADALKAGTGKLVSGSASLYSGILTMKNSVPALTEGITQLRDGAMQLSEGMQELREQGVQKLVDAVDGDLNGLVARVRATVDVSKDYQSFSGSSDDMDGQVKFIYRTADVKEEQD